MPGKHLTKNLTTSVGTLSFPHIFPTTKVVKDDGTDSYEVQFIIPKSDREGVLAILRAVKAVGEDRWGVDKWKKVTQPLRDGDKEADDLTEDGSTKGEKYPERLGCYFLNARSKKPVGVYARDLTPISDPDAVYGGCKVKLNIDVYSYANSGNSGIGIGLNGVQFIAHGDSLGSSRPSVESMFDMLDDGDDVGLDEADEEPVEETPPPAKKAPAKKAPAPTKKAPAKPAETVEIDEDDDLLADADDDAGDMFDDID